MKIIFSGGGTLGPVTPLLAIHEILRQEYPRAECRWVGTEAGPERELIEQAGIPFQTIAAGKLRRYFSFLNFFDIFRLVVGFFQSLKILWRENPNVCISAGGFVSVPLHVAAWCLSIPTWIHQQDVQVGLANRVMSPLATLITVVIKNQEKFFPARKTFWLGNPIRAEIFLGNPEQAKKFFGISSDLPVILVTGGGTGSVKMNQMVVEALPYLEGQCEIIHLFGKERPDERIQLLAKHFSFYHPLSFVTHEIKDAYALAEIVISRGGFGTLSELAALGKAAILLPKPGHQEQNVRFLQQANAALMLNENTISGLELSQWAKELLSHHKHRSTLAHRLQQILPPANPQHVLVAVKRFL